uniref:CSC1/OSCA1-like 7TM region domain-containing protein n=1 Tax=Panagrolaimus superbus TaxID=310955 RepID=A0A914YP02_9BILA
MPANELDKYLKDGKDRPSHRKNFYGCKKVDTLDYYAKRLGELNIDIEKRQHQHTNNRPISSVFIEFPSQLELQRAYQALPYNAKLKSAKKFTGITPEDVIWDNLNSSPITRKLKKIFASIVLTLMILFWSIPVTFIGVFTNINMLTEKVEFLSFINDIPDVFLGFLTGLLPVAVLAILMALVPYFIKFMGNIAGCLTVQEVETFCHSWYYAFQVIQSFLVLTLASAATSSISSVIDEPQSALTILGEKVPPASNFYIANTCYQSLTLSSGLLLQII